MFVTIGVIARSHPGRGGGCWGACSSRRILDYLTAFLRHSEGHFRADLDQLLVIVYYQ